MRRLAARVARVIRVDEVWLAVDPLDMRAGSDTALARVITVFGAAHPHHAYLFANRRPNRLKVLVHDGIGIWLAARRLNEGRFVWPHAGSEPKQHALAQEQLAGLVVGLPWQRIGPNGVIRVV
jgi:transposase